LSFLTLLLWRRLALNPTLVRRCLSLAEKSFITPSKDAVRNAPVVNIPFSSSHLIVSFRIPRSFPWLEKPSYLPILLRFDFFFSAMLILHFSSLASRFFYLSFCGVGLLSIVRCGRLSLRMPDIITWPLFLCYSHLCLFFPAVLKLLLPYHFGGPPFPPVAMANPFRARGIKLSQRNATKSALSFLIPDLPFPCRSTSPAWFFTNPFPLQDEKNVFFFFLLKRMVFHKKTNSSLSGDFSTDALLGVLLSEAGGWWGVWGGGCLFFLWVSFFFFVGLSNPLF